MRNKISKNCFKTLRYNQIGYFELRILRIYEFTNLRILFFQIFCMKSTAYEVLKIKDFRLFLLGRTSMTMGVNILTRIVQLQMVYALNQDAYALGLIGLAEFIPFLIVVLAAGWVADNFDRKNIILFCVFSYAICAILLLLLSSSFSFVLTTYGVLPMYIVIGLTGLVRGFLSPAQSALSAELVPQSMLGSASTWSTTSWHLTSVIGPAIGGFLYAFAGGATTSYGIVVLTSILGFFFFTLIPSRFIKPANDAPKEGFFVKLNEGISFVFKNQIILGSLALDMFAVLFGGAVVLIPVFAKEVLKVGPEQAALMQAAPAVGALVMAVILVYFPIVKHSGKILLWVVAGFGLCSILFAMSTNFWFSLLMLAGTGFFDNVSMVIRGTVIQLFTPNEMRGRVSAVNSLFIGSSNELGAFESGVAAKFMGLVPSVIFGGMMTLLVVGISWFKAPKLRDLDKLG
jgi:MFS family permease